MKKNIISMYKSEIADYLTSINLPKFMADQIYKWLYTHGKTRFEDMTNISKGNQALLKEHFNINRLSVDKDQTSKDTTHKWLLGCQDNKQIETVFIPELDRGAVCVSSQIGCNMKCTFCYTGTQKVDRNLTAEEIILQFMHVKDAYNEWNLGAQKRLISNMVFMGMGEPLNNYKELKRAITILTDGDGLSVSRRKITVSTCGIVPMMRKAGDELKTNLALSLHAPNDDLREVIMPINHKYSINEVLEACRYYQERTSYRRITIEYVMLKGVNDTNEHAMELTKLFTDIPVKFNLIPFNPWPGSHFEPSDPNRIIEFSDLLHDNRYSAPIRTTRGRDIMAACGQLKSTADA